MIKRLAVCGLGKLGSPLAAVFAEAGLQVTGYDIDKNKVDAINEYLAPVDEQDLDALIDVNARMKRLRATTKTSDLRNTQACIFITPTPSLPDGSFDNSFLLSAIASVAKEVGSQEESSAYMFIVASTVTPGSCEKFILPTIKKFCHRPFHLVYKPEFIALGSVIHDLKDPDFQLIGCSSEEAGKEAMELYKRVWGGPDVYFKRMPLLDAELAKISLNCFVTMKISFANQVGMVANAMNANPQKILDAIGCDHRVGGAALKPGLPYGGPCVPPHTLVQTTAGAERIDTIEIGDNVLTHDGTFHSVTEVHRRPYEGELVRVIAEGFPGDPLIATPEHPIWHGKRLSKKKSRFHSANGKKRLSFMVGVSPLNFAPITELEVGDLLALPVIRPSKTCDAFMNLGNERGIGRPSCASGVHHLNEELLYTIGWYLSEGSTWKKDIQLSLHRDEEKYINEIDSIWHRHLGVKTKIKERRGNGVHTRTTCAPFARWLRETFGTHCYDKHVPQEWLGLPEPQLKMLLRGMWYGDGSNSDGEFTWATTSFDLFNFMKLALLRLSIPFSTRKVKSWKGRDGTKHREAFFVSISNPVAFERVNSLLPDLSIDARTKGKRTIHFDQGAMLFHIKKIEHVPYSGEVFNLEVEGAESYVLEGATVHNCFPRDSRMFLHVARSLNVDADLARATDRINDRVIEQIALKALTLRGDIGILGMAYKPGTSFTEESPGMRIKAMIEQSEIFRVQHRKLMTHDPIAPHSNTMEQVLECPVIIVATAWPHYSEIACPETTSVIDPFGVVKSRSVLEKSA